MIVNIGLFIFSQTVPRRKRKVSIDPRFKSMFTDESFQVKCKRKVLIDSIFLQILIDKTDKRGSAVNQSSSEDLRKYYDIQTSEELFVCTMCNAGPKITSHNFCNQLLD